MAMSGHSPPHMFNGPGSPPRALNGHTDGHLPTSMYGPPRTMLPPSPQHYQHRFQNIPLPTPPPSLPTLQDSRAPPPPPYKRPGSSMSISSMLGGEPERTTHDSYANQHSRGSSRQPSISGQTNFNSAMSPPQQPSKPVYQDYNYKRARTPDRIGVAPSMGLTRQRSSSSGTTLQRPATFNEPASRTTANTPSLGYHDQMSAQPYNMPGANSFEQDERVRRTSLSGILQRPNSQPQSGSQMSQPLDIFRPQPATAIPFDRVPQSEPQKQNGLTGNYDTRPPGMNGTIKTISTQPSPPRPSQQSLSPELRRTSLNGNQGRGLASILNGPAQPVDAGSQRMGRQDSARSQGERSIIGENNKFRAYSPFASSFTGGPVVADAQGRKSSDELSQHRAILGLAAENKRGRYSPMPQAVQGAQAQTPVPDIGIRTERGRVFSGIGSGIGSTPTPGPPGLSSSPFKKDEGPMRLSEDNLKSFSRNTSGANKRPRKVRAEEGQVDSDIVINEKPQAGARKRNKTQHNYKADLEEMAISGTFPRRGTPLSGLHAVRHTGTPVNTSSLDGHNYQPQPREAAPIFKPRKTIKVTSIFAAASRNSRRHLGSFTYQPQISQVDIIQSSKQRFDVSLKPNLLPCFAATEHINCTYTVHVPRMWLQVRERGLICAEQSLWGSGIYTDDSDPVAAAIHAGFLEASLGSGVDTTLLSRVVHEQNPKIEFPQNLKIPAQPHKIEQGKDLNITMVVLPCLDRYEGSNRFGIKSRTWPENAATAQHDGVSFGILGVEFVDVGMEEIRVGRTGKGRRERLRIDLEARRRGLEIQKQKLDQLKKRKIEELNMKKKNNIPLTTAGSAAIPRSIPSSGLSKSYSAQDIGELEGHIMPAAVAVA